MGRCKPMKTNGRTNQSTAEALKAFCDSAQIVGSDRDNFQNFFEWFRARWQPGAQIQKIDPDAPWSPDNAYLDGGADPDGWTEEWSAQYRKARTPQEDPCNKCRAEETCTRFCPVKAKYWDRTTRKLKRMMYDAHGKRD